MVAKQGETYTFGTWGMGLLTCEGYPRLKQEARSL